jgi:hypothetical protein
VIARRALAALLGVVALAAAVLSFAALRDLAELCGFAPGLAWLLPVVVDAGAAGGSLVWLTGWAPGDARRFACRLALVLLGLSVAANAVGHLLALYTPGRPPWWVVAVASGVAPAVLGALIHLGVLCQREQHADEEPALPPAPPALPPAAEEPGDELEAPGDEAGEQEADRAAELIAAGVGRRKLARELQITEHEARELLSARRNGSTT